MKPIDELRALVERQRGLYGQLDALSQRQRGLAESRNAQGLLDLVNDRGPLVQALVRNAERIGELAPHASGDAALCRDIDALKGMARRIAERDAEDQAVMAGLRDEAAGELSGLRRGRQAMGAYQRGATGIGRSTPVFQDRRA